jgi:hypothetical protein
MARKQNQQANRHAAKIKSPPRCGGWLKDCHKFMMTSIAVCILIKAMLCPASKQAMATLTRIAQNGQTGILR